MTMVRDQLLHRGQLRKKITALVTFYKRLKESECVAWQLSGNQEAKWLGQ